MATKLASTEDELEENHDINVTPFIDVILVLLIIFMVAAPLSTVDINVDLPASTAASAPRPEKPVFISVKADLGLAIGDNLIAKDDLQGALDAATQTNRAQRIFVRADKVVPYGEVMNVMNLLRSAGYLKIGLVGLDAGQSGGASASEALPGVVPPASTASSPK